MAFNRKRLERALDDARARVRDLESALRILDELSTASARANLNGNLRTGSAVLARRTGHKKGRPPSELSRRILERLKSTPSTAATLREFLEVKMVPVAALLKHGLVVRGRGGEYRLSAAGERRLAAS